MKRQNHIEQLCKQYGIQISQRSNQHGFMYVEYEPPLIEIAIFDDDASDIYPNAQSKYLVALHEIGHCHYGHTQGIPPYDMKRFYYDNGVLHSEAQAWNFALDNCPEAIEEATARFMSWCLWTYWQSARVTGSRVTTRGGPTASANVEFVFDKPDEYFDVTVKRLQNSYIT